jgi:hypothetical protein
VENYLRQPVRNNKIMMDPNSERPAGAIRTESSLIRSTNGYTVSTQNRKKDMEFAYSSCSGLSPAKASESENLKPEIRATEGWGNLNFTKSSKSSKSAQEKMELENALIEEDESSQT